MKKITAIIFAMLTLISALGLSTFSVLADEEIPLSESGLGISSGSNYYNKLLFERQLAYAQ